MYNTFYIPSRCTIRVLQFSEEFVSAQISISCILHLGMPDPERKLPSSSSQPWQSFIVVLSDVLIVVSTSLLLTSLSVCILSLIRFIAFIISVVIIITIFMIIFLTTSTIIIKKFIDKWVHARYQCIPYTSVAVICEAKQHHKRFLKKLIRALCGSCERCQLVHIANSYSLVLVL